MTGIAVPWWAKMVAKIALSRLPVGYGLWSRIGIFRHGSMEDARYVQAVFDTHTTAVLRGSIEGKIVVELGPGDSVATALVAAAHRAEAVLVDTGPYARRDIAFYVELSRQFSQLGLSGPSLSRCGDLGDVLRVCGSKYLTRGLASLRELPAESVDLIFSHAVLEHVRKHEFLDTLVECHRILRPGGVFSNQVDLQDHLGGALNNLRFSDSFWESRMVSSSGFYTNRIRYSEMLDLFCRAGFHVEKTAPAVWSELPTRRDVLALEYQALPDDDLRVFSFGVVLRKT